jgi:RNA polymerase sigma-70 factor (ECF subfamily)
MVDAAGIDELPHALRTGRRPSSSSIQQRLDAQLPSAVDGDRDAVATILSVIHPLVVRYCRTRLARLSNHHVTADDVAQEVQIAVLKGLPRFDNSAGTFLPFVYSIARRKVIDAYRRSWRDKSEPWPAPPDIPGTTNDPAACLEHVDMSMRLRRLLAILTSGQREVLVLRVALGLTSIETASVTGTSPAAVRLTQHRALERLRTELRNDHYGLTSPTATNSRAANSTERQQHQWEIGARHSPATRSNRSTSTRTRPASSPDCSMRSRPLSK